MQILHVIMVAAVIIFWMSAPSFGADAMEKIHPAPSCAAGWIMDEKVTMFDKDTLFDRINGESELYFPYGFEKLAYARYANSKNPQMAIDIDIYAMGSLVDAFGMFANYRKKDDAAIAVGAGGTVSSSQVFFYQDRYFVRLQVTGTTSAPRDVFLACSSAVSKNLPNSVEPPQELGIFNVPEVVKNSERYIAQSLLGYEFFRKGMIADAVIKGESVQVFLVIGDTMAAAQKTIDQYEEYLKSSGKETKSTGPSGGISLSAVDPLYGNVYIEQAGRYVVGAIRIKDAAAGQQLVKQLRKKAARN